jgi:hypothetical protein
MAAINILMRCAQLSTGIAQSRDPVRVAALRADKMKYGRH